MKKNTDLRTPSVTKSKMVAYWVSTGILEFVLLSGGVGNLGHLWGTVEGVVNQLGYPMYFLTIIGVWKILGAIALLVPRFSRLQEWAYAGIFFEFTGAAASNLAVGNDAIKLVIPMIFAGLAIASWALRPSVRYKPNMAVSSSLHYQ
jgi:uncharacterized membrane protein YphA (DoxX/SURF4 family)